MPHQLLSVVVTAFFSNMARRLSLKVQQIESTFAKGNARWTNRDLDPVPRHARKWGVLSFIAYWISDAFNAATWQFASSILAIGLTWRESLSIVAIGFFIISIVIWSVSYKIR